MRYQPPLDTPLVLERNVGCQDPSGSMIENAFLILQVLAAGDVWRVFARLTVEIEPSGTPRQQCEAVTFQRVGG